MYLSNSNFHLLCFHICFEKNFSEQMIDLDITIMTLTRYFSLRITSEMFVY